MKEVKCTEWQKNPVPRMMWCWDADEIKAVKRMVLYLLPEDKFNYNVIAIDSPVSNTYNTYCHCAEIEEKPVRLMTKQELAWWLRKKPTRECVYRDRVYHEYIYGLYEENDPVDSDIVVRENGGAWKQPSSELLD